MWIIASDGYAFNDETDEEIYIGFEDGLYCVMHNGEEIETFYSAAEAEDFLGSYVAWLNDEE